MPFYVVISKARPALSFDFILLFAMIMKLFASFKQEWIVSHVRVSKTNKLQQQTRPHLHSDDLTSENARDLAESIKISCGSFSLSKQEKDKKSLCYAKRKF